MNPGELLAATAGMSRTRDSWLLPAVLRTTAGAGDVIGFLAFGGLFVAHITDNIVIVAAHYVTGSFSAVGPILAVPVFVAVLGVVTLACVSIAKAPYASRRGLLILHATLLAACLGLAVWFGPFTNAERPMAVLVGMLAVAKTRHRANVTFLCVVGFGAGCAAGAVLEVYFGLSALALPVACSRRLNRASKTDIQRIHLRVHKFVLLLPLSVLSTSRSATRFLAIGFLVSFYVARNQQLLSFRVPFRHCFICFNSTLEWPRCYRRRFEITAFESRRQIIHDFRDLRPCEFHRIETNQA